MTAPMRTIRGFPFSLRKRCTACSPAAAHRPLLDPAPPHPRKRGQGVLCTDGRRAAGHGHRLPPPYRSPGGAPAAYWVALDNIVLGRVS